MSTTNASLFAHMNGRFTSHPGKELLATEDGRTYRYADIDAESARLASYLEGLGVRRGDRVSVQVEKSPEALCLYLACLRAGFVYHPLSPAYRPRELRYFLENAEPALVVCGSDRLATVESLARDSGADNVLTLDAGGSGTLISESRTASEDFGVVSVEGEDTAALLYSSGTTGVPKGILLSHGNLVSNARALVEAWGFTEGDRLLHALPIFHVHGLFVAAGCVLLSGASMRWLARFSTESVIRFLPECTVMMGVPTYYTRLLSDPGFLAETCGNMRLFTSGSAPLREETFAEFETRTGHRILERYGMTETNMNTSNPLAGERKPGTVGPPLPGVEVRVVDDEGRPLGVHEIGNLEVRGPNVFKGYWRMPERTAEDFSDDGFFRTGDMARIDGDGYVSIVGRSKDMVISGGLNVYPKEVEIVIDGIAGVRESAVIGVPHADFGEAVVAAVVREPDASLDRLDEAAVIAAAREQLAAFKVPKRVVFLSELPRNTMAKVQKSLLRERFRDVCS